MIGATATRKALALLRRLPPFAILLALIALVVPAAAQPAGGLETYVRIDAWPEPGDAGTSGVLRDPVGLDVASDGRAYVADAGVGGVHIVEPGGPWRDPFGAQGQVYGLNHPRYDIPRNGYPIHRKCRAGVVHALGGDDVWIGDGTGACRLTPERHEYAIASTIAQGNICKLSVQVPAVRDETAQFFAIADIDRNSGSCNDGRPRSGKDTRLPTTPALVEFADPLFKRIKTITLATVDDRQDSGLIVPQHISVPAPT